MDERRRDAFAIEEIGRIKNYTNLVDIHARVLSPPHRPNRCAVDRYRSMIRSKSDEVNLARDSSWYN